MKQKITVLAFLLLSGTAFAQNRANFAWWNNPVVAGRLNLSPAQRQQIRQIVHSYRDRLIDARSNVQKAEGELQDVLNAEQVDERQSQVVIDRLARARGESVRVLTEMSVRLRSVLTYDQWREVVKRWNTQQRGKRAETGYEP